MDIAAASIMAFLGFIVLSAGSEKWIHGQEKRARVIADYRVLPASLVKPVATTLPLLELGLGLLLLSGVMWQAALPAVFLLMCLFAGGLTVNLVRGRHEIECGCFGISTAGRGISWITALRPLALAVAAFALYVGSETSLFSFSDMTLEVRLYGWGLASSLLACLVCIQILLSLTSKSQDDSRGVMA